MWLFYSSIPTPKREVVSKFREFLKLVGCTKFRKFQKVETSQTPAAIQSFLGIFVLMQRADTKVCHAIVQFALTL